MAAAVAVKLPLPFRIFQSIIIVGGGTYLSTLLFPKDVENVLFDVIDNIVIPIMHKMDAEDAHKLSVFLTKHTPLLCPKDIDQDDEVLASTLWDLPFSNPVGLAAGLDKDGEIVGPLLNLGFGFVEVGSVTPKPQPGNARPRVFRLDKDEAMINRYGSNSVGMAAVQHNLLAFQNSRHDFKPGLLGVNVGMNSDTSHDLAGEDFAKTIVRLGPSASYVVVNLSSPNTDQLKSLASDKEAVRRTLVLSCEARDKAVARRRHRREVMLSQLPKNAQQVKTDGVLTTSELPVTLPLLVKLSPDLSQQQMDDVCDVIMSMRGSGSSSAVDGIIVSNTTASRPASLQSAPATIAQQGGLSGAPLRQLSTQQVASVYMRTRGSIPIIGVGGISSGHDAFEKITAGASLVQLHSVLANRGPGSVRRVKRELAAILREKGFRCVEDAVGTQADKAAASAAPTAATSSEDDFSGKQG